VIKYSIFTTVFLSTTIFAGCVCTSLQRSSDTGNFNTIRKVNNSDVGVRSIYVLGYVWWILKEKI